MPLAILAAAAAWSWSAVDAEARDRIARTVDMLHEHALRAFETQEAILQAANQRISGLTWEEIRASQEVHRFLVAMAATAGPVGGVVLVGPDGRTAAASYEFPASPVDLNDRDYVKAHREGVAGTFVGGVIVTRPQGTTLFPLTRPRSGGAGFDGVVVTSFKPDYFAAFYRSVAEAPTDVVALVRDDGALLARSPDPGPAGYRVASQAPSIMAARTVARRGFVEGSSPIDGARRLYAYRWVGDYPVFVIYGLSPGVVLEAWSNQLAAYGTVCGLAMLALLLMVAQAQKAVRRERTALASAKAEAEARAQAEAKLRQAQRVEALGQIVGGVAHDFRNIIMAVQAGANRIGRRAEDPAEVRRVADLIAASVQRGARLTDRMLSFARGDAVHTEVTDVVEAVRAVADLLNETLGAGCRIEVDCPATLPPAVADRAEFETVLVNLALNARDAMPGGGTVRLVAAEETIPAEGVRPVSSLEPGRHIRIDVVDSGTGMDDATLERLGEAFFTTKAPGKGTGLGLTMARTFAETAGGALAIQSRLGEGTRVTLWLVQAER